MTSARLRPSFRVIGLTVLQMTGVSVWTEFSVMGGFNMASLMFVFTLRIAQEDTVLTDWPAAGLMDTGLS
jgi:hypothetical protein